MGRILKLVSSFMFAVIFTITLAACGEESAVNSKTSESSKSDVTVSTTAVSQNTEAAKEPVNIKILIKETGRKWNALRDSLAVAQEIKKLTGITIEYVESDESKFNVILASGDLPDIVRCDPRIYAEQLIKGKQIIPLDDLVKTNGPDILANIPDVVEGNKTRYGIGDGKLYFLTPKVALNPNKDWFTSTVGLVLRWDYYQELGAPSIKTTDDLLNILAEMQKKHPKTDEGKNVYGVSMWSDWKLWHYYVPMGPFYGETYDTKITGEYQVYKRDGLANPIGWLQRSDSSYWGAVEFYYKANKIGLLDPDALTQKYNDYLSKGTAGQLLYGAADWAMGDWNKNNASNGKGFISVPVENGYVVTGPTSVGWGSSNINYSISKSSKVPERCMDLLNFMFSYEGSRLLSSGIQGVHWDYVNGKPTLKDETIALKKAGGDAWSSTGILLEDNLMGLSPVQINPKDNYPVSLFESADMYTKQVNATEKAFSEFYGYSFPGQVFQALIDAGKMKITKTTDKRLSANDMTKDFLIKSPVVPDDIKKIESDLLDLGTKYAAKAIYAKSDAEFAKIKEEAIAEFIKAGADTDLKFYQDTIKKNRLDLGLPAEY